MREPLKLGLIALALASIASWFGEVIEPADLLSHFRLHFAAIALVLMLAAVFLRERWAAVLGAVLVAANLAASLYPHHTARDEAPPDARIVKLIALNSRWAADNAETIAEFLLRERPDIAIIEELTPAKRAVILPRLIYAMPWQIECAEELFCRMGLLSRHPWREAHTDAHDTGALTAVWADFDQRLGGLRVIGAHLTRPWPWWDAHGRQLEALIALARDAPGTPVIAGDLNASPWSRTIRKLGSGTGLEPAGWLMPTWPLRLSRLWELPLIPQLQLDYVLLPRDMRLLSIETGPDLGSDHLPVIARFVLPAPQARSAGR